MSHQWTTSNTTTGFIAQPVLSVNTEPNHTVTFSNSDQKQVGELDFNGDRLRFRGDADQSAKIFIEFVAGNFERRLAQERGDLIKQIEDITFGSDEQRETASIIVHYLKSTASTR